MINKILFENRYTVTEEMCKEFVYKVMNRRLYLYGGILTVGFLLLTIFYHGNWQLIAVEAFCLLGMILTMIISPKRTLKQYLATGQTLSSGKRPETVVTFDENHITVREGKHKFQIKYAQLKKMIRLQSVTMLMLSNENGLMIREDGFVTGDYDTFTQFIISKCNYINKVER